MRSFRRLLLGLVLVSLAGASWGAEALSHREQAKGYAKLKLGMSWLEVSGLMGPHSYGYQPNKETYLFGWCANALAGSRSYAVAMMAHGSVFWKQKLEKARVYCDRQVALWQENVPKNLKDDAVYNWHPDTDVYNIDKLKIRVTRDQSHQCLNKRKLVWLSLKGEIGPDSSFAVRKILEREKSCKTIDGENDFGVSMSSGGGLLEHGYRLGEIFREFGVSTMVVGDAECASSCAIAFLGGKRRAIDESSRLLFHSPYYQGLNSKGEAVMSCAADDETLDKLLSYYQRMIGKEAGEILLDRTMSYCSSTDGWVLTGNSSAELYGITQALGANIND